MYRRNQIEWAVWHLLDRGNLTVGSAPDRVVHLIRRLIDIDRQAGVDSRSSEAWRHRFAFVEGPLQGRGAENSYSVENVVALWLGIQFLALGVPQAEAVRFLRALRPALDPAIRRIHDSYAPRIAEAVAHKREAATKLRQSEYVPTENHVYVLTATVDFHGVVTAATRRGRSSLSNICWGRDELVEFVETYVSRDKRLVVLEIANAVTSLAYFLTQAPLIRRGREPTPIGLIQAPLIKRGTPIGLSRLTRNK